MGNSYIERALDPITWNILDRDIFEGLVEGSIRPIVRKEILPKREKMKAAKEVPDELVSLMAENHFFGMSIPTEYGGLGLGTTGDSLLIYELARGDMSASLIPLVTTSLFGRTVQVGGNDEQKKRILPGVASGQIFGCYGLTEPGGSSFPGSIKTTAIKIGDRYFLKGEKNFITEAQRAHMGAFVARIEGAPHPGYGVFLVPNSRFNPGNGYVVTKMEDKIGLKASATCALSMDDVEVPETDLLGLDFEGKKGMQVGLETLGWSRDTIASQALGNAAEALDFSMGYASTTERGGNSRIIDVTDVRRRYSVALSELGQGLSYVWTVASLHDKEGLRGNTARQTSSALKALATDTSVRICLEAMQLMGGYGYLHDFPVGDRLLDSLVTPIYEGENGLQWDHAGGYLARDLYAFHGVLPPQERRR